MRFLEGQSSGLTRRQVLCRATNGFSTLALASLLSGQAKASNGERRDVGKRALPGKASAKSIIYLYMEGGPSQIDTFDPKPRLDREHGREYAGELPNTVFNIGKKILRSPFEFSRHGESGAWVSEIFPHVARMVDDLTIIRSMHHGVSNHSSACMISHTGYAMTGKPCMGSWLSYGLGAETDELPTFVVLDCGQGPSAGAQAWSSGFLPASHQGTLFTRNDVPVEYITPLEDGVIQARKLRAIRTLNENVRRTTLEGNDRIGALIETYERAFRMQAAVPGLIDFNGESKSTRAMYGLDRAETALFGSRCLLARRLIEKGVRCVELFPPRVKADRWDQHRNLEDGHRRNALATDQPVAALLRDLKQRGLLDDTIVLWGGEFGRTPNAQGKDGRDHNPYGYTVWVAGGGFRPGIRHGRTDEYGYFATEDKVHIHDIHATILHQMGIDHEKLTYRFSGRDFRLTDVHGEVVHEIIV